MPRSNLRQRMTVKRRIPLDEDEYGERRYSDPEVVYTDIACLAVPDTRPVAILNAEISEPNRNISRSYWIIDASKYYNVSESDRGTVMFYSGDIISDITDRLGNAIITSPLNVILAGRKWYGWRLLAEEHLDRYDG